MVEVNFIVVDAYSPYTAILARPWLHAMEAIFNFAFEGEVSLWGPC